MFSWKRFTLQIDIAGFMHFWGLTVDTVTTIIMVIAIGLTVDYSAHIAHGFMAAGRGDRNGKIFRIIILQYRNTSIKRHP